MRNYILTALMLLLPLGVMANDEDLKTLRQRYGQATPLRIVADKTYSPYEFLDENDNPSGFSMELITTILDHFKVSYTIQVTDWHIAAEKFATHRADLMIQPEYTVDTIPCYISHNTPRHMETVVTYRNDAPQPPKTMEEMDKLGLTVMVQKGGIVPSYIKDRGLTNLKIIECVDMQRAVNDLSQTTDCYMVWGRDVTEDKIRRAGITNLVSSDTDVPINDIKVLCHDEILGKMIDAELARMYNNGSLEALRIKWFNPESEENNESPLVVYSCIAIALVSIILFVVNRITLYRIRSIQGKKRRKLNKLEGAIKLSDNDVIIRDLRTGRITNLQGNILPKKSMTWEEYLEYIHPDDRTALAVKKDELLEIKQDDITTTAPYRFNCGTLEKPRWRWYTSSIIMEYEDKSGLPTKAVASLVDITEKMEEDKKEMEWAELFRRSFDLSLLGMVLYNSNGKLLATNKKANEIIAPDAAKKSYFENVNLFDMYLLRDCLRKDAPREVHFCAQTRTQFGLPTGNYVEVKVRPVKDEHDKVVFYIMVQQSCNEERETYQSLRQNEKEIRRTTDKISMYARELKQLLKTNKMRIWQSSKEHQTLRWFTDVEDIEGEHLISEFLSNVIGDENRNKAYNLVMPDSRLAKPSTGLIQFRNILPVGGLSERWVQVYSVPQFDENGDFTGCIGLMRDDSENIMMQRKLQKETEHANESERQKSVFMDNMSHEIRTPLNAIVGFSEVIQLMDDDEQRNELVAIIRKNCDHLSHLVGDILLLSNIDSKGLKVKKYEANFAETFANQVEELRKISTKPGVDFIVDNSNLPLMLTTDHKCLMQVLYNFVTNAIKYTNQGHIRIGYTISNSILRIYCEDTGIGIPDDKQADIFERFVKVDEYVQGSGIGLSICKIIAEAMGGTISVKSKVNQGSLFAIEIPV